MKGLFIPEITAEMFRNGCLESIEALMDEGEIYDIDYELKRKKGHYVGEADGYTDARTAKQIVHDAIDNTPMAEDVFVGIKEKLHKAVDEFNKEEEV